MEFIRNRWLPLVVYKKGWVNSTLFCTFSCKKDITVELCVGLQTVTGNGNIKKKKKDDYCCIFGMMESEEKCNPKPVTCGICMRERPGIVHLSSSSFFIYFIYQMLHYVAWCVKNWNCRKESFDCCLLLRWYVYITNTKEIPLPHNSSNELTAFWGKSHFSIQFYSWGITSSSRSFQMVNIFYKHRGWLKNLLKPYFCYNLTFCPSSLTKKMS